MKTTLYLPLFCVFLFLSFMSKAQDVHFSQFSMTPLLIDPSQAGKLDGNQRVILNYKDQWRNIGAPFKTYGLSLDTKLGENDNFFGLGLSIYNDKAGDIDMGLLSLNASVAYHIRLNRYSYLSGGVQGGFIQRSIDPSLLRYDNQYDGSIHNSALSANEPNINSSFFQPDFAAGISYSYGASSNKVVSNSGYDGIKINVGAAVHHVVNANYSYLNDYNEKQSFKYILHTKTSFGINQTNLAVQPSGFIAYQQGATEFTLGSYFRYDFKEKSRFTKFSNGTAGSFGVHYRTGDALLLSMFMEIESLAFGLSYDVNLSGLTVASKGNGGFEMSIKYVTPSSLKRKRSSLRFF